MNLNLCGQSNIIVGGGWIDYTRIVYLRINEDSPADHGREIGGGVI